MSKILHSTTSQQASLSFGKLFLVGGGQRLAFGGAYATALADEIAATKKLMGTDCHREFCLWFDALVLSHFRITKPHLEPEVDDYLRRSRSCA
jgi:hypothetical protein